MAEFLRNHPKVTKVYYVGFEDHKDYQTTIKQTTGFGGMLSFEVDSEQTALQVLDKVDMIVYPTVVTHHEVPIEEREKLGINDRLLRLSVGIEDPQDIINDLAQALD